LPTVTLTATKAREQFAPTASSTNTCDLTVSKSSFCASVTTPVSCETAKTPAAPLSAKLENTGIGALKTKSRKGEKKTFKLRIGMSFFLSYKGRV
jgi:hypothetical protein